MSSQQETADGRRPSWKPRAGNYYIMSGTWLVDTLNGQTGVVKEVSEIHEGGTIVILWYTGSTEYCSTTSFRRKLMRGRYEIDESQHPYDKVDWEVNA